MKAALFSIFSSLFFLTQSVKAEPMYIEFTEMMEQATTIVLATYIGPISPDAAFSNYQLKIQKVLKGTVTTSTITVSRAHGAVEYDLSPNTEVIAFLNTSNEFEWVGTTKGKNIEKDVLFLRGFYDYNAYMVAPSSITLPQLNEYLTKGHYSINVIGNLHFYDSKTQTMQPSKIQFNVKKQYPDGEQSVQTKHLNLGDFSTNTAKMSMPSGPNGILVVEYESNTVRPLKFLASLQGFDAQKKAFNGLFWVVAPEEMTPQLFDAYLKNEQYGHPYYEIEIQRDDLLHKKSTYRFTYNEASGRIGTLTGYNEEQWTCSSLGDPSDTERSEIIFGYYKKDKVIIRMNKLDKMVVYYDYPYRQDRLIRVLRVHPIQGQVIYKDSNGQEQVLGTCNIKLKATKWAKNINYRE